MQSGLHSNEQGCRLAQYGANSIDVPVKSYHVLLIEEVLHPFYIFQVCSSSHNVLLSINPYVLLYVHLFICLSGYYPFIHPHR